MKIKNFFIRLIFKIINNFCLNDDRSIGILAIMRIKAVIISYGLFDWLASSILLYPKI
jgi:hypothetical protein